MLMFEHVMFDMFVIHLPGDLYIQLEVYIYNLIVLVRNVCFKVIQIWLES